MSEIILPDHWKRQPPNQARPVAFNGVLPKVVLSGIRPLQLGLSNFTTVGTPTVAAHQGGAGYYFGSGNYFSTPIANTVGVGTGTGNEASRCFFEVFVVGITSNAATTAFFSENSSTPADGNDLWILQNNAGTLRQYAYGGYTNIKAVSAGEVVTIVRRYSDFSPYPQETWCNGELVRSFNQYRLTGAFVTHAYFGTGYPGAFTGGVLIHYAAYPGTLISQQQASDISRNPWGATYHSGGRILYFPSAGGGGATTGTGAPAAQSATVAGTATRTVTGSGTPTAQAATAAGTAEREITSSGTPSAQSSTVSGSGSVSAGISGSGTLSAQSSTVAGTATRTVTASGSPAAQSAAVAGTAEREITGTGTPAAQASTVAGTGQVGNIITGSGTPAAQSATVAGTAERTVTGSGSPAAQASTVAGTGVRTITGSGAVAANDSTVYGYDTAPVPSGDTGGGGSRRVLIRERKVREEVDEWLAKNAEKELLKKIQREDEEIVLIMALVA